MYGSECMRYHKSMNCERLVMHRHVKSQKNLGYVKHIIWLEAQGYLKQVTQRNCICQSSLYCVIYSAIKQNQLTITMSLIPLSISICHYQHTLNEKVHVWNRNLNDKKIRLYIVHYMKNISKQKPFYLSYQLHIKDLHQFYGSKLWIILSALGFWLFL